MHLAGGTNGEKKLKMPVSQRRIASCRQGLIFGDGTFLLILFADALQITYFQKFTFVTCTDTLVLYEV